ncbi:hydrogenase maturation nickel metallochaperone HypA [Shewanella gelidii]|uniref:Hydrogenase maturation factor HypA n=1 Tax=Shewanella gelidii TaxID=1642821 RepID=A0A917JY04_9GAMM|nr:hydrogenase maturation nickel metallochaperone HypA [Shewanella gelidii]MCL1098908.1 hydrogenase maturation nickel metallochaperone HypA [Shewanella gelidii]GGI89844.1 hydrogenase nickel incorporation protein HypA [Shewanella gelidii]
MHELGVVIEVVKTVSEFAKTHQLQKVDTIVLQIGQLSSMIPKYIEDCYPAAVDGTPLEHTKLAIEVIPAEAICKQCHQIFNILQHQSKCPDCQCEDWGMLSGKEFLIKEVIAY